MSAETLRRAASLMRERAGAATWVDFHGKTDWQGDIAALGLDDDDHNHVASWSPAVALAVADWLDAMAARAEVKLSKGGNESAVWAHEIHALKVAKAYLGESS